MGKRPRTPHFITGIGDGNVHDRNNGINTNHGDDAFQLRGGKNRNNHENNHQQQQGGGNENRNNPYSGRYYHLDGGAAAGGGATVDRYSNLRAKNNERLQRLEEPLVGAWENRGDGRAAAGGAATQGDRWRDVFGASNGGVLGEAGALDGSVSAYSFGSAGGPWQVSAFAFLGMIVVISAIFLHFVSESGSEGSSSSAASSGASGTSPYHYRRRQRQRRKHQMRKKKTDEWSDDEEPIQNGAGLIPGNTHSSLRMTSPSVVVGGMMGAGDGMPGDPSYDSPEYDYYSNYQQNTSSSSHMYPSYYQDQHQQEKQQNPPSFNKRFETQDSRLRKTAASTTSPGSGRHRKSSSGGSNYYTMPSQGGAGLVPTYKSPAPNMLNLTAKVPVRDISPMHSYSSANSGTHYGSSPGCPRPTIRAPAAAATPPISGRLRIPSTPEAKDVFPSLLDPALAVSSGNQSFSASSVHLLPAPHEESPLLIPKGVGTPLVPMGGSRPDLKARPLNSSNMSSFESIEGYRTQTSGGWTTEEEATTPTTLDYRNQLIKAGSAKSVNSSRHQQSLLLSPGNAFEETPLIGNVRTVLDTSVFEPAATAVLDTHTNNMMDAALLPPMGTDSEQSESAGAPIFPFIPTLGGRASGDDHARMVANQPPRSILMDELRLVQMETGSMHWEVQGGNLGLEPETNELEIEQCQGSFFDEPGEHIHTLSSEEGSDISIPSGDPRKGIIHKRSNLTMSTDASASLQSSINFGELHLQEVIGGGGFGQVWRASWRGTPVAVKVLTGSAQNSHIAKAILEEFKAEINLLKGMRHPNICLYMGACVDPPNRAIITELAANGSVWDALRLPLTAQYTAADGTPNGSWPMHLYVPDQHGAPPSSHGGAPRMSAPIPPKGTWPWELVKRVSCGAARGMAYLHSGKPPVLHRDLKSANILADESYTPKVCDFGLSRIKNQARSMTGNCGTVQWMAPEVLANRDYDEKADVYSYGIILWELLSRECPYEGMTAIQCALAVLNRDKRPEIPKWCPPGLHALIKSCVKKEPSERPSFAQIILALDSME